MKLEDILKFCCAQLDTLESEASSLSLFREIYRGPMTLDAVKAFIDELDRKSVARLFDIIDSLFMDSNRLEISAAEMFILRQRFGNAVLSLSALCSSGLLYNRGTIEHTSSILQESAVWSLTVLWDLCCNQWENRSALALCEGQPNTSASLLIPCPPLS